MQGVAHQKVRATCKKQGAVKSAADDCTWLSAPYTLLPRHAPFATSLATAAPFWSWIAVAAQRGLRRQNDVKISKFRVLGQQIACDYRYSRLINVVEQTATAHQHQDGAWLRMCRKHHRMRRQAFCSFSPLLIGTFGH